MKYEIDSKKCRKCKMCLIRTRCPALNVNDKIQIDSEKCTGCGMCYNICPVNAIYPVYK